MKYEIFGHTADIGIKIFGNSYEELFNNSVESFADLIVDISALDRDKTKHISLSSGSPDLLLVDLLSLILYEFEADGTLYFTSRLSYDSGSISIQGDLYGKYLGEDIDYRNVIKAVTYHSLKVLPEEGYATVVFDI